MISRGQRFLEWFSSSFHFQPIPNSERRTPEMEITQADNLKEQLMTMNPEFRELAREHGRYEERLSELSALSYPNDEEQLEEITLKKKKLAIKDQMHSIMLQFEKHQSDH
jgi:hypothetical protein